MTEKQDEKRLKELLSVFEKYEYIELVNILARDQERYHQEQLILFGVVKSLPNDEEVKAHIDTLPYYGTCSTEYNEGFEDGVKWLKAQR